MAEGDNRGTALVEALGWEAFLGVHRVFDAHLEQLHAAVDAPLALLVRAVHLRRQLNRHIQLEERAVLPHCSELAGEVRENVLRDHGLIRESMKRLEETALLAHFGRVDRRRLRQRVVELDRLLEHHDDREAQGIYGPLATELAEDDKARLLSALATTELRDALAGQAVEALVEHATLQALCDRYRAWLSDSQPSAADSVPSAKLQPKTRAALPKLLARDDREVARAAGGHELAPRERAKREVMAELSLRSTITFVLESLVA